MTRQQLPRTDKNPEGLRAPLQSRSQHSTDRMLDAALAILDREGMEGLSIAAVSRESGVSNGALYHRFGDRHGLLVAAQDRFLSDVTTHWIASSEPLWSLENPEELLTHLVALFLQLFADRRSVFHAFMVTGRADPDLHAQGARMMRRAADHFASRFTERFGCTSSAAATAHQILQAQAILLVVFGETATPIDAGGTDEHRHLVRALSAVLQSAD
ncbi:TetR/AcrR family transcriptional regulator [Streptomyces sp. NPDC051985]|uniref:TetR/AcrR family transcriptional regulator n=1 Tax=Streptomyces sp. NPDC051985 TaxID=3155807 RepID=UPI00343294B0